MTDAQAAQLLDRALEIDHAIAVVVGAHHHAEIGDRPTAHGLARELTPLARSIGGECVVLSDLWYLNAPLWRSRPTVSVGGPEVNALTASLADRLPSVHVVDDELMIQMDLDGTEPLAACWGVTPSRTAHAVAVFCEKYLPTFADRLSV
ncbi:MAG: hypothetical protein RIB60_09860 [Phycisphaerales bacterium]